jgi:hypothetical protein
MPAVRNPRELQPEGQASGPEDQHRPPITEIRRAAVCAGSALHPWDFAIGQNKTRKTRKVEITKSEKQKSGKKGKREFANSFELEMFLP